MSRGADVVVSPDRSMVQILFEHSERRPKAPAVMAPGRDHLDYAGLQTQLNAVRRALNARGLGRGDRIALALPEGPELTVACIAVSACAVAAPLNPDSPAEEFFSILASVEPKAIIMPSGSDSPAAAARTRGIPVLTLSSGPDQSAGIFELAGGSETSALRPGPSEPGDEAVILHTTGTTGGRKSLVFTHSDLCAKVGRNLAALQIGPDDRTLSLMPLFHSTGFIGVALVSLLSGGSVVCPPGFDATRAVEWIREFEPTWYTAVPHMHTAILARLPAARPAFSGGKLRFLRSGSAPLPLQLLQELESAFGVPLIEAYGMTETGMITCNPLPPRPRKPGSVGVSAGLEVGVRDENGRFVPAGTEGEIVARGPGVFRGYETPARRDTTAFTDGWFRTGDYGFLDAEGYLFLTGRLKEVINSGGEKISPVEVEHVLRRHPAVRDAAAFAVPHATLSEEVGAAVTLREGARATESEIRRFAAERLALFKVPRQLRIVAELPTGEFGKIERSGLASKLGLSGAGSQAGLHQAPYVEPTTETTRRLAAIWAEVLAIPRVGLHDDFFASGGDSILATRTIAKVGEVMGIELSPVSLFETPTLAEMADTIERALATATSRPEPIRAIPRVAT